MNIEICGHEICFRVVLLHLFKVLSSSHNFRPPVVRHMSQKLYAHGTGANPMDQWRSQKFGLAGAVGQFWLKSLINIEILHIKC